MTNARTTAALAAAATILIALSMMLVASPAHGGVDDRQLESVDPESTVVDNDTSSDAEVDDPIRGVRVVTDHPDQASMVADLVARFDQSGWLLTNTEIRFDPDGCNNGAPAFQTEENGRHVVVMCTLNEYTLLWPLASSA